MQVFGVFSRVMRPPLVASRFRAGSLRVPRACAFSTEHQRASPTPPSTTEVEKVTMERIMSANPKLHKLSVQALNRVFHHPISHDLHWHETQALLADLKADIRYPTQYEGKESKAASKATVSLNNETVSFARTQAADTTEHKNIKGKPFKEFEVMELRRFLTRAHEPVVVDTRIKVVVLVDHDKAAVITLGPDGEHSKVEVEAEHYHYDRSRGRGDRPHLPHKQTSQLTGDLKSFFKEVRDACGFPDQVVVVGHGQGKSDVSGLFLSELERHAPTIAKRVLATLRLDAKQHTEGEIVNHARKVFEEEANLLSPEA